MGKICIHDGVASRSVRVPELDGEIELHLCGETRIEVPDHVDVRETGSEPAVGDCD